MRTQFATLALLPLLAACGGGGDSLGLPDGPPEYTALAQEAVNIANAIDSHTSLNNIPTSGSPTFDGVMLIAPNSSGAVTGYTGDVSLTANFTGGGSGTISGTATGFYRGDFDSSGNSIGVGTAVDGTVTLNSASVNTSIFGMTVGGDLAVDGSSTGAASGTMEASFTSSTGANPDAFVAFGENVQFAGSSTVFEAFVLAD